MNELNIILFLIKLNAKKNPNNTLRNSAQLFQHMKIFELDCEIIIGYI